MNFFIRGKTAPQLDLIFSFTRECKQFFSILKSNIELKGRAGNQDRREDVRTLENKFQVPR